MAEIIFFQIHDILLKSVHLLVQKTLNTASISWSL